MGIEGQLRTTHNVMLLQYKINIRSDATKLHAE